MRKKLFSIMALAIAMFAMFSCSDDNAESEMNEGNTASLAVTVGFANEEDAKTKANKITIAVYDEEGNEVKRVIRDNAFDNGEPLLFARVPEGKKYDVAAWLQYSGCEAYNTIDLRNVTVNYEGAVSNDHKRDVFMASLQGVQVDGYTEQRIELARPTTLINLGDANCFVDVAQSEVTISNLATSINVLSGEMGGSQVVTFDKSEAFAEYLNVDTRWRQSK